jgi:hypothetical protein
VMGMPVPQMPRLAQGSPKPVPSARVPVAEDCPYCTRVYAPSATQCEGCGAPRTVRKPRLVKEITYTRIDTTHLRSDKPEATMVRDERWVWK